MIPVVIEKKNNQEYSYDLYSRLLTDRIIFLGENITDEMANSIVGQLLFLDNQDNTKPINMYINSGGGCCSSGFAIIDTMNYIKAPVYTTAIGCVASMGATILCAGEKGHRYSLPNSEIMIHQIRGGVGNGKYTDMEIYLKQAEKVYKKILKLFEKQTGKSIEQLEKDMKDDNWMSAQEALDYGIIDKIIEKCE